ncbi:MAG: hypothetical protein KGJ72_06890 [Gammaproteobacteria bacterium]|nr:hypothetical protein [Gammaproteobacteria bacterium]
MATRQFSRSRPGCACSIGGTPSAAPTNRSRTDERLRQLALLALRLRVIYGTALSAELALRQQAAERDPEIADCLRAGVCDPIAAQIQELEEMAYRLRGGASQGNL